MKDVLRELYNGEIYPAEQIEIETAKYRAASSYNIVANSSDFVLPFEVYADQPLALIHSPFPAALQ